MVGYQAPLRTFLNTYAESKTFKIENNGKRKRIGLRNGEKTELTALFDQTMGKALAVFKEHTFRAYIDNKWERPVNRALFDAVTLVFSQLPLDKLVNKAGEIEAVLIRLFENPDFRSAVSDSKAHPASFTARIKMFSQSMADIGLDTGIHLTFPE